MSTPPCEICQELKQRQADQSDRTLEFNYPLTVFRERTEKCGGICSLLLEGIECVVSDEDRARTHAMTLGGGRGTQALFRLAGADQSYSNFTFNVEYYMSKTCNHSMPIVGILVRSS
jgi:hypothetical protein